MFCIFLKKTIDFLRLTTILEGTLEQRKTNRQKLLPLHFQV
jgi:hypothetical protein